VLGVRTGDAGARHRGDIQGLRAVAVLLVALGHAGVPFLKGGFVGVDVFFVLSGFLITQLLLRAALRERLETRRGRRASRLRLIADFYSRRARRILPAAALTLIATDLAAYHLLNIIRAKDVLKDSIWAALFSANIHFAGQGTNYFAQGQPPSPIQHFWSLGVEEQFYVVWPLVLSLVVLGIWLRHRRGGADGGSTQRLRKRALWRLFAVVALILGASLVWSVHDTSTQPAAAYFSTLARAWELAIGAAIAIVEGRLERVAERWRNLAGWVGLGCVGVGAVAFSSRTPFPGSAALLPTAGAGLIIFAGLSPARSRLAPGRLLGLAPLRYVGDRSYSFYLWHWPFLIVAEQYEDHALSLSAKLLLLLAAFGVSILSYGAWENPLRRLRWRSPGHALVLWPASVCVVLIVAGWSIRAIDVTDTRLISAAAPTYPGLGGSSGAGAAGGASAARELPPEENGQPLAAVVSAAQAAARHAAVPHALSPPLPSLMSDHYEPAAGCAAANGQTSSKICPLGQAGASETMVVLGDSHAQMWIPALEGVAQRDRLKLEPITKTGCSPAEWYVSANSFAECTAWYGWAQAQVARLHPTVAVVAGSFSTINSHLGEVTSGLAGLVSRLRSTSRAVLVVGDPPDQAQQPVDCLLAPGATMDRCSVSLSPQQTDINRQIAAATTRAGGTYIDTTGWFCARGMCPMVIDGMVAYRDQNHVTATYSRALSGVLGTALRRALARERLA
jgi:peptidoglycan/LPS O-acetylase OafA/YrhL